VVVTRPGGEGLAPGGTGNARSLREGTGRDDVPSKLRPPISGGLQTVVRLYDRNAADVRALLTFAADIFRGDPDGTKGSALLARRDSIAQARLAGNCHGRCEPARQAFIGTAHFLLPTRSRSS
jgi:hypothetical protein